MEELKKEPQKEPQKRSVYVDYILRYLAETKFVNNCKASLKANPKRYYFIMLSLCVISITYNIVSYATYEKNDLEISKVFQENRANKNKKQKEYLNIKKELDLLKNKDILSKTDTLKIKFLLKSLEK